MNAPKINTQFLLKLFKDSGMEFVKDNAMRLAAALAYYAVFSIAPLIMIAIGILGWFYGNDAANGKVAEQLGTMVGANAAEALQTMVQNASKTSTSSTLVGFVVLLFGASSVFAQLKDSLDTMWEVQPKPGGGIWSFIRQRLLSFGMVLVIGFLLLISLILTATIAAVGGWIHTSLGIPSFLTALFGFVVPLFVETALFALIFKVLPSANVDWRDLIFGAVFTAVLFEVGKVGLSWYLAKGGATSSFGAAGSLVLVLLWVYYASNILFFGATLTEVWCRLHGRSIQPAEGAESTEHICQEDRAKTTASGAPVEVQPSPLRPGATVPAVPLKETLLPMLRQAHAQSKQPVGPRIPPRNWQEQVQVWAADLHAHPFAEVGAALGVGLAAGFLSRAFSHDQHDVSATEHFRLGAQEAGKQGKVAVKQAIDSLPKKWRKLLS